MGRVHSVVKRVPIMHRLLSSILSIKESIKINTVARERAQCVHTVNGLSERVHTVNGLSECEHTMNE